MFNAFFDVHGGDGVIEKADIEEMLEKLRKYCGYLKSDPKYMQMNDVMYAFYNSMVDQVRKEKMCSGEAEGYKTVITSTNFEFRAQSLQLRQTFVKTYLNAGFTFFNKNFQVAMRLNETFP